MIFNFYISGLYMFNQLLLFLSLIWFFGYGNFCVNLWDIYSRSLGNELYVNLYYFLWTSFWYIPLFITIIIIWQLTNRFYLKTVVITLTILMILWNIIFDVHLYWVLNTNPYSIPLTSDYYNNLLLNSINKYHPGLLYWSSLLILTYWLILNFMHLSSGLHFSYPQLEFYMTRNFIWSGLVLTITLSLGGWWALQEGSWGGWWNWDPSEVFGLLILLFFIVRTHKAFNKQNLYKNLVTDLTFFLLLYQVYFFTQLNFDLVSHNFGTKIDNFIDNTNLYTLMILLSYLYVLLVWFDKFYLYKVLITKVISTSLVRFGQFGVYTYFIVLIFSYELVYSLIPLFNDFIWKLFSINVANYILIFEKYNLQLLYLIIIYFWKYNQLLAILFLYVSWGYWTTLLLYVVVNYRAHFFFHWLIIWFFWLSLLTFSYISTSWGLNYTYTLNLLELSQIVLSQPLLNFNNLSLDYTLTHYLHGSFDSSWNTVWVDTTVEVYSFTYSLLKDISSQVMLLGTNIFPFSITINDTLSLNLLLVFFLLCALYIYHFFATKQIIF